MTERLLYVCDRCQVEASGSAIVLPGQWHRLKEGEGGACFDLCGACWEAFTYWRARVEAS